MGYSLGFWLNHTTDSKNTTETTDSKNSVELHINYWSIESKDKFHYLDIGIKLNYRRDIESINFFFPFEISHDDYMGNLGQIICSKDYLLELIFNEKLNNTTEGQNYKDVSFEGNESVLRIYKELDITNNDSNIKLVSNDDGTSSLIFFKDLIKKNTETEVAHYLRFRIRLTPENIKKLSQNYTPQDRHILSRVEEVEIVDFRINELRDLPGSICHLVNKDFKLEHIHFFLIRDINDQLQLAHTDYKRCRLLEKKVWQDYLVFSNQNLVLPEQMLIYHFSECKKNDLTMSHLDKFNAFAKFSRMKITDIGVMIFISSVILLGILSGLLTNWISSTKIFQKSVDVTSCITTLLFLFFLYIFFKMYKKYTITKRK